MTGVQPELEAPCGVFVSKPQEGTLGSLYRFLAGDHVRLDALLRQAAADPERIDRESYARFRGGLLRHIAIEEKVLLPDAKRRSHGQALAVAKRLRADHGALAALLVPTPTHAILRTIREILEAHNPLEEGPDGLYATCEALAGAQVEDLLSRVHAVPEVPLAPHFDSPRVHEHIANLLRARSPAA